MFVEEASWLAAAIARLELGSGSTVLDVGSSTHAYRTRDQPHIDHLIFAPLRARGCEVIHLDAKPADGVDIVFDLDRDHAEAARRLGGFDLVLSLSLLAHLRDPAGVARALGGLPHADGALIATSPRRYRRTMDPRDNGLRVTPIELAAMFCADRAGLARVEASELRIDADRYYRPLLSRASWVRAGSADRWLPLPGGSEWLRRQLPALRWRQSCVLLRAVD